jgi:hypothetical protein
MKRAVDKVYRLLWIKTYSPTAYDHIVRAGNGFTLNWDLPEHGRKEIWGMTRVADFLGSAEHSPRQEPRSA